MFFLRSPLNFPWILKIGVRKELAFSTLSLQGQWYGKRLSKKLRKRLYFRKALQWYSHKSLTRETLWLYLHRLTQDDLQCFEMTKELRSNRFSLEQCYYLLRLARLLDDPPKSIISRCFSHKQSDIVQRRCHPTKKSSSLRPFPVPSPFWKSFAPLASLHGPQIPQLPPGFPLAPR